MAELTPDELRELPRKDKWTPEQALALYEDTVEGIETMPNRPESPG